MSKIFGEVIATPGKPKPFAAVFYSDEKELTRYEANSRQEAEAAILEMLSKLAEFVKSETSS